MLEDVKKDATVRMQKCVAAFKEQLKKMRTGRAHTSLIEHIKVDYYGSEMPLNQVATITVPEPQLITVTPFDPSALGAIEKAIRAGDLGMNPMNDGKLVRVPVPGHGALP